MKNRRVAISTIAALMVLTGGAAFFSTLSAKKASAETVTTAQVNNSATNQTNTTTVSSSEQVMADKLAAKLGVDADKVKSALDEIRQEKRAEHQARVGASLDQAVKDGVITSDQKQKILDKQTELQKQREQERTNMESWAKDNGIDLTKLKGYLGRGMGKHLGK